MDEDGVEPFGVVQLHEPRDGEGSAAAPDRFDPICGEAFASDGLIEGFYVVVDPLYPQILPPIEKRVVESRGEVKADERLIHRHRAAESRTAENAAIFHPFDLLRDSEGLSGLFEPFELVELRQAGPIGVGSRPDPLSVPHAPVGGDPPLELRGLEKAPPDFAPIGGFRCLPISELAQEDAALFEPSAVEGRPLGGDSLGPLPKLQNPERQRRDDPL